jgi:hypothetical protein
LIVVSFFFTPQMIRITPPRWINLPYKQYWLKEENRGRTEAMLSSLLYQFGTLTFVFMLMSQVSKKTFSNPRRGSPMWSVDGGM